MLATGALPVEAQAFQIWYSAKYPDNVAARWKETADDAFPDINAADRSEQKRRLRVVIETYRAGLVDDPKTDSRALIFGPGLGS